MKTEPCSMALAEIINLKNLSEYHRKNCNLDYCGVSLHMVSITAKRLVNYCSNDEKEQANRLIKEMGGI